MGKCWPHKSRNHGDIRSPQWVQPPKLPQHAFVPQLRKCSNVLTVALGDDKVQATTAHQLVGNERRPPLQQLQVPSVNTAISSTPQNTALFSPMFSSCTIGNVHVYNYKLWQNNSLSIRLRVLSFTDDGNIAFFFHFFSCLMKGSALNYSSARSSLYKSCYDWPLRVSWQCKRRRNLITLIKTQFRPKNSVLCMKLFYKSNRPLFVGL